MLGSFTAGFKLVMMYKWDPARALELIERERITVLRRRADDVVGPARESPTSTSATPAAWSAWAGAGPRPRPNW